METIEKIDEVKAINPGIISKINNNTENRVQVKVQETDAQGNVVEKTGWKDVVSKKWYESKTVIFNMGIAVFTGLGTLVSDASFQEMMGEFFSYILTLVTIVNVYLRTITSEALEKFKGN